MRPSLVSRLVVASAAAILIMAAAALWTRSKLADASQTASLLAQRSVQGIEFAARLQLLLHQRSYVSNYLLTKNPNFLETGAAHPEALGAWIEEMDAFAETATERTVIDGMRLRYLAYTADGDRAVRLAQAGDHDGARGAFLDMKLELDLFLDESQALFALVRTDMQERQIAAAAKLEQGHQVLLTLTTLGALVSLALAVLLARLAVRPLSQLVLRLSAGRGDTLTVVGDELQGIEVEVNRLLERVRAQERALQQAEKLSELGMIAAEVAHETLNPLAGVKGIVQVVRRTPQLGHEAIERELAGVERELGRVEQTVTRLVRYSRPLEPQVRDSDVRALANDALERSRLTPGAEGHPLVCAAVPEARWPLDPDLIAQVLVNLLVNACEASPAGAGVELQVTAGPAELTFEVLDRGCGIAPALRERVFRPFFTTKEKGNGLGLAVSRNIVSEHGGRMEAVPRDGGGSIFRVVLPKEGALWRRAS